MINRQEIINQLNVYFRNESKSISVLNVLASGGIVTMPPNYFCLTLENSLRITVFKIELTSEWRWNRLGDKFGGPLLDSIRTVIKGDVGSIPGAFLDAEDVETFLLKANPLVEIYNERSEGLVNCFIPIDEQIRMMSCLKKQ